MLSETTQELYNLNFSITYKLFIIAFFFITAILIIKNFKPKKKTKFIAVKWIRSGLFGLSWLFIYLLPITFGFLAPEVPLDLFIIVLITIYTLNLFIILGVVGINFLWYGIDFINDLLFDEPKSDNPIVQVFNNNFAEDNIKAKK